MRVRSWAWEGVETRRRWAGPSRADARHHPRRGVSCGHRADFGERRPPPPCPARHGRRVDRAEETESPDAQMRIREVRLYRQDPAQMAWAGRSAALPD